jgi:selenocysteine lyase/cysteine desulfurase
MSCFEHNSVLRPVHKLYERGDITYSIAKVNPLNPRETLSNFLALVNDSTAAVTCTMVSNVFGTVMPIEELGRELKKRGILFIVDAAQGAGTYKIDMKKMNIDILCMPGHKGLMGPMGTGMMIMGENVEVESFCQGGTGSNSMSEKQPDVYPDKLESGTVNLPGIWGLKKGMDYISCVGGEKAIHEKENYLCRILKEDMSLIKNVKLYSGISGENHAPLIAFNIKNMSSEEVAEALDNSNFAVRAGYHCAYLAHKTFAENENGVVRVSPGWFNTKKDIKNLAFSLNKIAKRNIL